VERQRNPTLAHNLTNTYDTNHSKYLHSFITAKLIEKIVSFSQQQRGDIPKLGYAGCDTMLRNI
jgi:hypothetical protein